MREALLLVAHGSRSTAGQAEVSGLVDLVASARPEVDVGVGFLELCEPAAGAALDDLVRRGADRVAVLPVMLHAAGHAKSDVASVVVEARLRHPDVLFAYGRPLGADHGLLTLAHEKLRKAGATGLPLAVLGRGTSDPEANAEGYKIARLLAEFARAPFVTTGFSGVTWPSFPEALVQLERFGAGRVATFAWFLATGVLIERMHDQLREFSARTGIEVVDGGYLGADEAVAAILVVRHAEALAGDVRMSCDTCAYRRPFPGLEDRVGQPIGVGHSHLAFAHQHAHFHGATKSGTRWNEETRLDPVSTRAVRDRLPAK